MPACPSLPSPPEPPCQAALLPSRGGGDTHVQYSLTGCARAPPRPLSATRVLLLSGCAPRGGGGKGGGLRRARSLQPGAPASRLPPSPRSSLSPIAPHFLTCPPPPHGGSSHGGGSVREVMSQPPGAFYVASAGLLSRSCRRRAPVPGAGPAWCCGHGGFWQGTRPSWSLSLPPLSRTAGHAKVSQAVP